MNDFTKEELKILRSGVCRLIANMQWESTASHPLMKLLKKLDELIND